MKAHFFAKSLNNLTIRKAVKLSNPDVGSYF